MYGSDLCCSLTKQYSCFTLPVLLLKLSEVCGLPIAELAATATPLHCLLTAQLQQRAQATAKELDAAAAEREQLKEQLDQAQQAVEALAVELESQAAEQGAVAEQQESDTEEVRTAL